MGINLRLQFPQENEREVFATYHCIAPLSLKEALSEWYKKANHADRPSCNEVMKNVDSSRATKNLQNAEVGTGMNDAHTTDFQSLVATKTTRAQCTTRGSTAQQD